MKFVKASKQLMNKHSSYLDLWRDEQVIPIKSVVDFENYSNWITSLMYQADHKNDFHKKNSLFFLINERDEIVGAVDIEHKITDKFHVGHITYGVAPKHRSKGYGKFMLQQTIEMCHKLGVDEISFLFSNINKNVARNVESLGGVLVERDFIDDNIILRYKI